MNAAEQISLNITTTLSSLSLTAMHPVFALILVLIAHKAN